MDRPKIQCGCVGFDTNSEDSIGLQLELSTARRVTPRCLYVYLRTLTHGLLAGMRRVVYINDESRQTDENSKQTDEHSRLVRRSAVCNDHCRLLNHRL